MSAAWFGGHSDDADARRGSRLDSRERAVVRSINRIRRENGLPRLRANRALSRSADSHTRDMLRANFFGHASSNGQSMQARVSRFRPSNSLGENLAYVERPQPARAIVNMWMASPGHRAVLLSPQFRRIGIGRRIGRFGSMRAVVYTADFASAN